MAPLGPDSINSYRPSLGNALTIRQFPFGLANQPPKEPRLTHLLSDGKTVRSYQYNQAGQLAQRTDYYTNGIQIFRQFTYQYGVNGAVTISGQLNQEAATVEGYPKGSDLLPSATIMFTPAADSLSRIERNTQTPTWFCSLLISIPFYHSPVGKNDD